MKLSEFYETEKSLNKAVNAFRESLKIYMLDKHPANYAVMQSNLCSAYITLAGFKDTGKISLRQ